MNDLARRLSRLEAADTAIVSGPSVADFAAVRALCAGLEGERQGNESLAQVTARLAGITVAELKVYLRRRASGQPAETVTPKKAVGLE